MPKIDKDTENFYSNDSLKQYMKEINMYPLLSNEEFNELFRRYKNGDFYLRDKLIKSNLRLVVSVVMRYKDRLDTRFSLLDVIQEGNIGLMRALETFDPKKSKFSTYATTWIESKIGRYYRSNRTTIRENEALQTNRSKYYKILKESENKGEEIPSDEEICKRLNISDSMLEYIRNPKTDTVSLNKTVNDEEDTELLDFISGTSDEIEDLFKDIDNGYFFYMIKSILPPREYYVIYNRYLSNNRLILSDLAQNFNVTRESIRIIESKALRRLKNLLNRDGSLKNSIELPTNYEGINILPVDIDDLFAYLYYSTNLNDTEREYLYLILVDKNKYGDKDFIELLHCTEEELENIKKTLPQKLKGLYNERDYGNFKESILKSYGTNVLDLKKLDEDFVDYIGISDRYKDLSYDDIVNKFGEYLETLSDRENSLLKKYFSMVTPKVMMSNKNIEREINILLFDYKYKSENLPLDILYKTYLANIEEFNEDQRNFLECFVFKNKISYNTDKKLTASYIAMICNNLKEKLEKLYFNVYRFSDDSFTKEKYLYVRKHYKNKISKDRLKMLDLFYGVRSDAKSISEMSEIFGLSYVKMHSLFRDAKTQAINLYCNKKSTLDIDASIYKPYIEDTLYEFTPETRKILTLYIIENKSYEEISKATSLSKRRISNIVTEGIRKIDFYRFGIVKSFRITVDDFNACFSISKTDYTEKEKNILRYKYFCNKDNSELVEMFNIDEEKLSNLVQKFNSVYKTYLASSITIDSKTLNDEVSKHFTESILNDEEKAMLSYYYGVKNKFNPEGVELTDLEISKLFDIPLNTIKSKIRRANINIKLRKSNMMSPDLLYIPRSELDEILNDSHLPISDKERYIICSLFELKNHKYKTLDELSGEYNENKNSIRRRYYRSIVSINKYLAGEIERVYSNDDIYNNLKYFSNFDRKFLVDYYINKLSYESLSQKYNLTFNQIVSIFERLSVSIYEIVNDKKTKKFDFDYYYKVVDNDDLPFYGDKELAKKVFELYFGQDGEKRYTHEEIKNIVDVNLDASALSRLMSTLILSVCKYRYGIRKNKEFTYEEIKDYFIRNMDSMDSHRLTSYRNYLKRAKDNKNCKVNTGIIRDLLEDTKEDYFHLENASKEDILNILRQYKLNLSKNVRENLMMLFDISEREFLSGTNINQVFKILNKLERMKATDTKRLELI